MFCYTRGIHAFFFPIHRSASLRHFNYAFIGVFGLSLRLFQFGLTFCKWQSASVKRNMVHRRHKCCDEQNVA